MHLNRRKAVISVSISLALLLTFAIIFNSYSKYFSLPKEDHESICAHYDKNKRVIFVICNSTLSELYETIADDHILRKETSDKIWFLNSSIFVSKGVVLTIKPDDVKWLKISSCWEILNDTRTSLTFEKF